MIGCMLRHATCQVVTVCNMRFRYAVGDDGVVLKYANALASDAAATLDSAVSASSPEVEAAVVSIGSAGTWSVVSVPSTASTSTLYGVHVLPGVESADVVVVGSAGLLMELERGGQSWTVKDTPTTKDLLSVHTSSPVHGYTAVGRDATILYVLDGVAPRGGGGREVRAVGRVIHGVCAASFFQPQASALHRGVAVPGF